MKFLIAGLGNIGPEYKDTRHNAGFMVLDELAKQQKAGFITERYATYTEFNYKGKTIYLIKPTTFMNLSGKAVNYWMQILKIPVENLLVVVDELALPFGTLRLKPKGGDAGHNGLKHIHLMIGTTDYARLRFGVGDSFPKGRQVDYVLSGFDSEEKPDLPLLIYKAAEMILSFVAVGTELTMTRFNG
mgnify:FL=1